MLVVWGNVQVRPGGDCGQVAMSGVGSGPACSPPFPRVLPIASCSFRSPDVFWPPSGGVCDTVEEPSLECVGDMVTECRGESRSLSKCTNCSSASSRMATGPLPCWEREGGGGDFFEERRGGGGSGTQKCVYQQWPDQMFPMVNFVFSHDGHFGLEGGGGGPGGQPPFLLRPF